MIDQLSSTRRVALTPVSVRKPSSPVRPPLPALTGLRILAALMVFWHHLPVLSGVELPPLINNFKEASYVGVILFFMLRGFVLTYNYYDVFSASPWYGLRRYLVNRFARIYPLLLCVVLLSMMTTGFDTPVRRDIWTVLQHITVTWVWNGDIHLTVERAYVDDVQNWSLGVEFFLYALLPFLIWALLRHCTTPSRIAGCCGYGLRRPRRHSPMFLRLFLDETKSSLRWGVYTGSRAYSAIGRVHATSST